MHNTFLLCIMGCLALVSSCIAQELIPRLGFAASTVAITEGIVVPGYNKEAIAGIAGGVELYTAVRERIGIAAQLMFVQKGWSGNWAGSADQYEDRFRMNYIDLAVVPVFRQSPFYIMAGPSVAAGINGNYENTGSQNGQVFASNNGNVVFGTERKEPSDVLIDKRLDLTATFVAGVILAERIFVDIRYQHSLVDFFEGGLSRHKSLQLTTGIRIAEF